MKEDIKQYGKESPHHRQCLNCRKGMQHDHHCIAAVHVTQLLNFCTVLVWVWETLLYTFRWKYEAIQSFPWWPCSPAQPTAQALTAVGWLHFIFCWYLWSYFFNSYIPGHFITQNWTSFLNIPFVLILDQYQERYSNFKAQYHKVREPLAHEGTIKNVFCIFPVTLSIFHQILHMRASSDAEFKGLHNGGIGFEIWLSIDVDI